MSFAADVSEARRLDRRYVDMTRERATAVARDEGRLVRLRIFRAVPTVVLWTWPVAVMTLAGADPKSFVFAALAIATVARTGNNAKKDVRLTPFEAMYMPSRRALLVARWVKRLPWSLWVGACAVWYCCLKLADASAPIPVEAYVAVALAPTLWAVFAWFDGDRDPSPNRVVCEFAFLAVRAALATAGAAVFAARLAKPDGHVGEVILLALCALLAVLFVWALVKSTPDLRRAERASVSPIYVVTRIVAALSTTAWFVALAAWTAVQSPRAASFVEGYGTAIGVAGLVVTFGAGAFYVAEHLRLIRTAEVESDGRRDQAAPTRTSARPVAADVALPRRARPGVDLWRAQWRLPFLRNPPASPAFWIGSAFCAVPAALAAVAVLLSDHDVQWWAIVPVAFAPRLVAVKDEHARRLHLFGVDFREQKRHNLRSLFLVAMPPLLLAASVGGTIAGWTDARVAALCAIVGAFLLRAGRYGFDADDWLPGRTGRRLLLAAWLVLIAGRYTLVHAFSVAPSPADWSTIVLMAAIGILSVLRGPWRMTESELVDSARDRCRDDAA